MGGIVRSSALGMLMTSVVFTPPAMASHTESLGATPVSVDYCQLYPCQEGDTHLVFPVPPTVTPFPCDADGHAPSEAVDETADLQAWIDLVPDGEERRVIGSKIIEWHVLLFPPGLCIRMDGHLTIQERNYLIFEGGGVESEALTVDGVTLDQHLKPAMGGPDPTGSFTLNGSGGWFVKSGSYLQWRSFRIVGGHSEKEPYYGGAPSKSSTYGMCHFHDSDDLEHERPISSCEWQSGWGIFGAHHVTLEGNETRNTHGDSVEIGWDVHGDDYWTDEVVDARYITINNHRMYAAGRQGISAVSGQDLTISNSYLEGAAQHAIDLEAGSSDNRFPIRRVNITNNEFGESYFSIGMLNSGVCADVTDVSYTHNVQTEHNFSWLPSVMGNLTPSECDHPVQRGPLTITDNYFWVESGGGEDLAGYFRNNDNVTFSSNTVRRNCGGMGCTFDPNPAAVAFEGGSGHVVNNNILGAAGSHAPWTWVYSYDGVNHGSLGNNVSSCGNTTVLADNQPSAC